MNLLTDSVEFCLKKHNCFIQSATFNRNELLKHPVLNNVGTGAGETNVELKRIIRYSMANNTSLFIYICIVPYNVQTRWKLH